MVQLGLPVKNRLLKNKAVEAMLLPMLTGVKQPWRFFGEELPEVVEKASRCRFVLGVYFEKHFAKDLVNR